MKIRCSRCKAENSVVFLREYSEPMCPSCYLDLKDATRKQNRKNKRSK